MIIDTHCHLDDKRYKENFDEIINNSMELGVGGFIIPGADINDLARAKELSYKYNNIYFAVGIHPYQAKDFDEEILKEFLQSDRCIAVGECGLDYFRLPKDELQKEQEKKLQKDIFEKQLKLAVKYKLPVIVHIRDASRDSLELLLKYANDLVGGVLHCYNASEILLSLSKHNFYFGIGGVVTFKNAKKLVEILPKIPLDKLLLETDSPYLTPHPYRGKLNNPSYTTHILEKMANILDIPKSELEKIIFDNTKRLFKQF